MVHICAPITLLKLEEALKLQVHRRNLSKRRGSERNVKSSYISLLLFFGELSRVATCPN